MKKGRKRRRQTLAAGKSRGRHWAGGGDEGGEKGGLCSAEAGLDWHLPAALSSQASWAHMTRLPATTILPLPTILRAYTSSYFLPVTNTHQCNC